MDNNFKDFCYKMEKKYKLGVGGEIQDSSRGVCVCVCVCVFKIVEIKRASLCIDWSNPGERGSL